MAADRGQAGGVEGGDVDVGATRLEPRPGPLLAEPRKHSIDLAARSSDEVVENIGQVREARRLTDIAAGQVLTSATELEGQAATLSAKVGEFLAEVRAA